MSDETVTLYRPVGQAELDLIRMSGFRRFPSRLPEQPFFYPVLTEQYSTEIAHRWNTKDERSGFVGYVLRFQVKRDLLSHYEIHTAGSSEHREYWIPAADLIILMNTSLASLRSFLNSRVSEIQSLE